MESVLGLLLSAATFLCRAYVASAVQCESYYTPFPAHDNCLYISTKLVSWDSAHGNCAAYGNTLINIDSQETAQALKNLLAAKGISYTEWWTGLNDHWQEGQYRWSRGEPMVQGNFLSGQPDDNSRSQNCGMAKKDPGSWAWRMMDMDCFTLKPHICENWPNDKVRRGALFSRQRNVTEANLHLIVKAELRGSFPVCRHKCLASAYCEALAVDPVAGRCKILFFKTQSLAQRQSLLSELASHKIYLRTGFDKHY